jgi:hypothetical protein
MTIGDGIKERLLAITPLVALVGTRVFELLLPQNERRVSVRFFVLGSARRTHIRGPINQFQQRVQVDGYVPIGGINPIDEVNELGKAILGDGLGANATGLAGWSGIVGGSPDEPLHVFDVDVLDDGQLLVEMDEIRRVRIRQEYRVHWRTAAVEA